MTRRRLLPLSVPARRAPVRLPWLLALLAVFAALFAVGPSESSGVAGAPQVSWNTPFDSIHQPSGAVAAVDQDSSGTARWAAVETNQTETGWSSGPLAVLGPPSFTAVRRENSRRPEATPRWVDGAVCSVPSFSHPQCRAPPSV